MGVGFGASVNGALVGIDSSGAITVDGGGLVTIAGGTPYDSGGFWKDRSFIRVGTDVNAAIGSRTFIDGEYVHIPAAYRQTASSGSWLMVAPDGALIRSTSASKI